MNEIKTHMHSNRVADVIAAPKVFPAWGATSKGSQHNLVVYVVKGSLAPLSDNKRHFSLDLGDEVVDEYKIELHCEDLHVNEFVTAIADAAHTGQPDAGWIYVTDIVRAEVIL